ncbi:MAG: hypothetical protein GY942_26860 [Aestuariibacter sp.]|nr:hypothetical protein [Halieaceae bacterium]MCP5013605.1 hypothetical protein [Aestuariibacter sp.]
MSNKNVAVSKQPHLEEVMLIKDHTHKGEPCKAGDKIHVNEVVKAWLIKHEIIAATAADK